MKAFPAYHPSRAEAFTLIELLGAIMVLTVLVVMLLPAFRAMHGATLRQQAAVEASELAQAALAYRKTYGSWPLEDKAREDKETTALLVSSKGIEIGTSGRKDNHTEPRHLELADVVNLLRGLTSEGEVPDGPLEGNPRNIPFIELPSSSLQTGDDDAKVKKGTPLDPWGRPYVLVLSRPATQNRSMFQVGRIEGGVYALVRTTPEAKGSGTNEQFLVDLPDDAVAFSWGDPLMRAVTTNSTTPAKIVGSWSLR